MHIIVRSSMRECSRRLSRDFLSKFPTSTHVTCRCVTILLNISSLHLNQYHSFYGTTSCCTSQWPKQRKGQILTPPIFVNHLTNFRETLITITPQNYIHAKFDFNTTTWVVWWTPSLALQGSFFVLFGFITSTHAARWPDTDDLYVKWHTSM